MANSETKISRRVCSIWSALRLCSVMLRYAQGMRYLLCLTRPGSRDITLSSFTYSFCELLHPLVGFRLQLIFNVLQRITFLFWPSHPWVSEDTNSLFESGQKRVWVKKQNRLASCVDPDETAHYLIWIYTVCKGICSGLQGNTPVSILYKSIAGRYRPVRVADGPITARYRFIKNASWDEFSSNGQYMVLA